MKPFYVTAIASLSILYSSYPYAQQSVLECKINRPQFEEAKVLMERRLRYGEEIIKNNLKVQDVVRDQSHSALYSGICQLGLEIDMHYRKYQKYSHDPTTPQGCTTEIGFYAAIAPVTISPEDSVSLLGTPDPNLVSSVEEVISVERICLLQHLQQLHKQRK